MRVSYVKQQKDIRYHEIHGKRAGVFSKLGNYVHAWKENHFRRSDCYTDRQTQNHLRRSDCYTDRQTVWRETQSVRLLYR